MRLTFAILCCTLTCSCLGMHPPDGDIVPPTVMEFRPLGDRVPLDTRISVLFTEPVAPDAGPDGLVMVAMADGRYNPLPAPRRTKRPCIQ